MLTRAALMLALVATVAHAAIDLAVTCKGNLLLNGGFEQPNPAAKPTEIKDPSSNSRWGWYYSLPGWYTTRPDGKPCVKVDWQRPYMEVARNALATAPEGMQYGELLPNATGNYCQDVKVKRGQRYKLSFQYGRLMTYAKGTKEFTSFETAADALVRPASYVPRSNEGRYPSDSQGYTRLVSADTRTHESQWKEYNATFVAPSDKITLALVNTIRPKTCGACGSLVDAVCLVPA